MNESPKYVLAIYEDYALINGKLSSDILLLLIKLCKKEGFTHMTHRDDGKPGFKLIRNADVL
jgi:hypothetical protein